MAELTGEQNPPAKETAPLVQTTTRDDPAPRRRSVHPRSRADHAARGVRQAANVTAPFIQSAAVVAGGPAWLLSRVLHSPGVATVVACPPSWLDRADVAATLAAIHLAASAFEAGSTARERETAIEAGAVAAHSDPDWTVRRAADYLRLSPRRVQELASELGGRKVGRQWLLDEVAVREYGRRRKGTA